MPPSRGITALTAAAALVVALASCGADGSSSGAGGRSGDDFISIGLRTDQPGLAQRQGTGYAGFEVEVARYVAEELGFTDDQVHFVEAPVDHPETLIQSDRARLVLGSTPLADAVSPDVSFAGPYFVAGQDLLVRSDVADITGPATLNDKSLCSVAGAPAATRVTDMYASKVRLRTYDSDDECVAALSSGAVDAVTADNLVLAGLAAQPQYQGDLTIVGQPFSTQRYGVALARADTALCEQVNAAIEKMISDGSWQRSLDATVGASRFRPDSRTNPPKPNGCS